MNIIKDYGYKQGITIQSSESQFRKLSYFSKYKQYYFFFKHNRENKFYNLYYVLSPYLYMIYLIQYDFDQLEKSIYSEDYANSYFLKLKNDYKMNDNKMQNNMLQMLHNTCPVIGKVIIVKKKDIQISKNFEYSIFNYDPLIDVLNNNLLDILTYYHLQYSNIFSNKSKYIEQLINKINKSNRINMNILLQHQNNVEINKTSTYLITIVNNVRNEIKRIKYNIEDYRKGNIRIQMDINTGSILGDQMNDKLVT